MASLAQLPELVGFFSYSREDDQAFRGSLSALRDAIQRDLSAQLGRTTRNFRLWQDQEAIAPGQLWESQIAKAIDEAVFFIPILTPRAVASKYCKFEFEAFLARERALARNDLVFPIHYILVPGLLDEAERRNNPVLSMVAKRQYVDWRSFRHASIETPVFGQVIDQFCGKIAKTLREHWLSPKERETKQEVEQILARAKPGGFVSELAKGLFGELLSETPRPSHDPDVPMRQRNETSETVASARPLTAAQERAVKPGDSFKEGTLCPEMIVLPAGRFLMGSAAGQGHESEYPQHEVTIAKPFAVGKFAVTFDEWDACAAAGGCRSDVSDSDWGRGRRPAIAVDWDDAQAYVKWLSGVTGKLYRLLSEAEYEYAARAGSQTKYPWGDDVKLNGTSMANCEGCGSHWDNGQTAPVGSFAPNAFGLHDMVGNVWAWTEDCWNESYRGAPTDGSTWTSGDCSQRVNRGGCWNFPPVNLRSARRIGVGTNTRVSFFGFRVARTLSP
jgi:formylglycine-generating enzyme required for sulfatase activity